MKGNFALPESDALDLLDFVIEQKKAQVDQWYGDVDLNYVQRGVLVDMAYQSFNFLNDKTKFYKAVHGSNWDEAFKELEENSNKNKIDGIARRNKERGRVLREGTRIQQRLQGGHDTLY
jgi:hypothetical protein